MNGGHDHRGLENAIHDLEKNMIALRAAIEEGERRAIDALDRQILATLAAVYSGLSSVANRLRAERDTLRLRGCVP